MNTTWRFRLRRVVKNRWLLLMTLPGMLFLLIFSYLPMFGILIAFKDFRYADGIWGSKWVGFKNFEFLFATRDVWSVTFNTLMLNSLFIVCGLIVSVALALLMFEVKNRILNTIFQSSYFLPYLLSWVLVGYFVYAMLTTDGFVNQILAYFGIESVSWFTSPGYWPAILVLVSVWKSAGYTSIIYLASILGINTEYYEAAKLDGATKLQQVFYITLPLIIPVITIMMLLQIGRIFYADFGLFYNVTRDSGMLYATTDVIDTYVFRMLRKVGDFGMASAAGFYQAVVGFILVFVSNLIVRKVDKDNALF
ncbi:ABC transporter permease [Paenibacillus eucommiae]|uniref:Aldouronate transport system permease protein n=1 Tax=Paenibacillus eucommiae TaxID=1355755 RepID=A0ABS4J3R9_9BACL|nr:ABC transporter permease subunit [Paenibacillus eucommiae]MBP1994489.1 putative aldouronate transport system permease protein [Paenibacillus eucommiae]